jgi:hypothetical protein
VVGVVGVVLEKSYKRDWKIDFGERFAEKAGL